MNIKSFLKLVKTESRDFSVDWALGNNSGVTDKSQTWLNNLSDKEKIILKEILEEAIDNSLINLFEILDGVHNKNKDRFEIKVAGNKLTDSKTKYLHDKYPSILEE